MVERFFSMEEVPGSIPGNSKNFLPFSNFFFKIVRIFWKTVTHSIEKAQNLKFTLKRNTTIYWGICGMNIFFIISEVPSSYSEWWYEWFDDDSKSAKMVFTAWITSFSGMIKSEVWLPSPQTSVYLSFIFLEKHM